MVFGLDTVELKNAVARPEFSAPDGDYFCILIFEF